MFAFTPQPAPQGDVVVYSYPQGGVYLAQNVLHAVAGSSDTVVSRFLDRNIGGAVWMPGGQALLACGDDGPHATMWSIALEGTIARIGLGPLDITCDSYSSSTFDSGIAASVARNGSVALIATGPKRARELYYLRTLSAAPKQVTHFNDWLGRVDVGTMTQFRWDGPKGQPEDGVVTYPPNMEPGKRYPLVVFIHGGPGLAAVDSFVWESWPEAQLIASRGYVVFQPNYRGSDENGNAFMLAIARDTVRGPADDIMSGVAAVKRLPAVDASRVAVCGWSYGGLLTSWLVTQTHAWKAAVSGAAVNDEIEEYNLSVSNVQNRYYLGTSPYAPDGMKIYADQSPITYASDITTPMLIWSTTGDPVVPTTMSYSLYHALLDNQRTVKFVEFVAPTHGPSNPKNTEEITTEWLNWLDKYLR
jgi:dipeptidyl aminopeptidase/acylaminoacyl peptidase